MLLWSYFAQCEDFRIELPPLICMTESCDDPRQLTCWSHLLLPLSSYFHHWEATTDSKIWTPPLEGNWGSSDFSSRVSASYSNWRVASWLIGHWGWEGGLEIQKISLFKWLSSPWHHLRRDLQRLLLGLGASYKDATAAWKMVLLATLH